MNIDWSKSPEGATHWDPVDQNWLRQFYSCAFNWLESKQEWAKKGWQYPDDLSTMPRLIARPASWTGEGLPPVGTVCEFKANILGWVQASITAVTELSIVFTRPSYQNGRPLVEERLPHKAIERFRPIRTPEQIAAEERELAITDICLLLDKDPSRPSLREKAGIIYDAGYRKQAQP